MPKYISCRKSVAGSLCLLGLVVILGGCTHLDRPGVVTGRTDAYIDWGKEPPGAYDRAKHMIKGEKPFEWWYFDGHLDNGRTFVGVFLDPSFTTGKPGVAFSLYDAEWSKETRLLTLEPEEMKTSLEDAGVECPVGFVRRLDEDTYHVMWDMEGLRAEFRLTTIAPGWRPSGGDGVNEDHLDFFWAVHQARNRVEGTITVNGVTEEVAGIGYADHNWGKKALNDITRNWIWGRILAGEYTIIYADVDYYDASINSRPLYIARGSEVIAGSGSPTVVQWDFVTHPALKRHYPRRVRILFNEGDVAADITIHHKALVEDVDLLTVSGLNQVTQWFARTFVARPTYFRIMADYEGIITRAGVKDTISGECMYEIMGFQ
jgi:hypothetical protein